MTSEVVITSEMVEWAHLYATRYELSDSEIRADFFQKFGEVSFETWQALDKIMLHTCGEYERELYPGREGKVYQLPASRGATWYVVQRDPGYFTCNVKHFPKKQDGKREARRIRREIEHEIDEEHKMEREMDEPHFDSDDVCDCSNATIIIPRCGGCICGCRRGCVTKKAPYHNCEFHEDHFSDCDD